MVVDVSKILIGFDGQPLIHEEKQMSLRSVISSVLMTPIESDTGDIKLSKWLLAKKIFEAESTVDLSVESIVMIKELIAKNYTPYVVGPSFQIIGA